MALRGGIPIECIIDQAKSIRPCTSYVCRSKSKGDTSEGTSCPSAIGLALQDMYNKIKDNSIVDIDDEELEDEFIVDENEVDVEKPKCPECGEPLAFEGGCIICHNCGYSKCD